MPTARAEPRPTAPPSPAAASAPVGRGSARAGPETLLGGSVQMRRRAPTRPSSGACAGRRRCRRACRAPRAGAPDPPHASGLSCAVRCPFFMSQSATYLCRDNARYWYATPPTVTKLADDRAELPKREPKKVADEIRRRVKEDLRNRGEFPKVHAFPGASGDVPDELETRRVVVNVYKPFGKEGINLAVRAAKDTLEKRGKSPRPHLNTLVFLAADRSRLDELEAAARCFNWRLQLVASSRGNPFATRQRSSISTLSRPDKRLPKRELGTRRPRAALLKPSNGSWPRCRARTREPSNGRLHGSAAMTPSPRRLSGISPACRTPWSR